MKNLLRVSPMVLLVAALMSISACTEDYFDLDRMQDDIFTWTPDLAIPLVFSSLTVADIIAQDEQNYYQIDGDNFSRLYSRERSSPKRSMNSCASALLRGWAPISASMLGR